MQNNLSNICPLCTNQGDDFYEKNNLRYYKCPVCDGIYMDNQLWPNKEAEKLRYQTHNNDVNDRGYQQFVSPITSAILINFSTSDMGLDFGAGTGPVISKILNDNNYNIKQYDPYFHNKPKLLTEKYNFIACCEVIEHFYNPLKEFQLLKKMLIPNGKLYCMTDIFNKSIDFNQWYYKNDPTHVFIYQQKTFEWIKKEFRFTKVEVEGRLITFTH